MVKLQVTLSPREADALSRLATAQLRDPREQIRLIVRRELRRRRLLELEQPAQKRQAKAVRHA
jgi:hypothetical protein